jgi:hypothetical protein
MGETLTIATLAELVRPHLPKGAASLRLTPIRTGKHNASFSSSSMNDLRRFDDSLHAAFVGPHD